MPLRAEPVDLAGLVVGQLAEVADVAVRGDHEVPRRVGEAVQQGERMVSAVDDECVIAFLGHAEHAALLLVRALDVFQPPRGPELLHHRALLPDVDSRTGTAYKPESSSRPIERNAMSPRGLVPAVFALALAFVVPAYAHTSDFDTVPDAAGDGDPDITRVVTGSNSAGSITFVVGIGNRTQLAATELVQILIDSDNNVGTGQQPNGAEYELEMSAQDVHLLRWNGSTFERVTTQTAYGYIYNGFRLMVNKSELGGVPNGAFRYWVHTTSGAASDDSTATRMRCRGRRSSCGSASSRPSRRSRSASSTAPRCASSGAT